MQEVKTHEFDKCTVTIRKVEKGYSRQATITIPITGSLEEVIVCDWFKTNDSAIKNLRSIAKNAKNDRRRTFNQLPNDRNRIEIKGGNGTLVLSHEVNSSDVFKVIEALSEMKFE